MPALPPASFLNFLAGLGNQALVQLGELPHPQTGQHQAADPAVVRYSLELLRILQGKTAGNLDADEQAYLDRLVADLASRLGRLEES